METRANYVIVGIFTIVAVIAAFGFVYWTANVGSRGETVLLRIRIPGSASGLGRGSAVQFNGVNVGDIRRVYLDVNKPTEAIADAQVDRNTPITRSTQADIGIAGLTGQANVELKGAKTDEPNLLAEAEQNGTVAEITANPSAVTNLLETAQDIFTRADSVMTELEGFVRESRPQLTGTFENAKKFSDALARNADGVDKFLDSVSKLSDELAGVSGKLDGTLKSAEALLNSVDRDQIRDIVANADDFTKNLKRSSDQLDGIMKGVDTAVGSVNTAVASLNTFARNANQTLTKADGILDGVDPEAIKSSLANIREASADARKAVEDVSKVTSRFGDRADDIDKIISDAGQIADRLNKASVRVDGVLAKLDSLLGSGEAEGVMADASATLKEFRKTAEILNSRIAVITDNLANFSGPGLTEVRGLVRDSRRSVDRIERAITNLANNPQRIITGGEGAVRQYDGRMRR